MLESFGRWTGAGSRGEREPNPGTPECDSWNGFYGLCVSEVLYMYASRHGMGRKFNIYVYVYVCVRLTVNRII